jgi:alpha,alpha-trehalose phosphorylase
MRYAARCVAFLREFAPDAHATLVRRTGLTDDEPAAWHRACDAMFVPYDDELGIHPQDASFLERERWDFASTPPDKYPLLLHFHPLVIYRFQVLKQADVVLAMFLRRDMFDDDQKRRNFDYYDPLTTGDSSLSACVQAIAAADIGYDDLAWDYFEQSLYLDLADTHGNTSDGVHIANAGGMWAAVVHGFGGLADNGEALTIRPRLPDAWASMSFRLHRHGSDIVVRIGPEGAIVEVTAGNPVPVRVGDEIVHVDPGGSTRVPSARVH